ncbi:MAG: hypothetical protein LBJ25_00810 [Candidatus Margulisbacteria bacterium]|jgi:hypothetical protein|nr:hypothetical protein [Candidatus Margulisiibacteriota bacterium]
MGEENYIGFTSEAIPNTIPESLVEQSLTEKQQKIIEILKTFNNGTENIYLAGIYIWQTAGFPAKQSVVAHCFRELINAIIRRTETDYKNQIIDALKSVDFIKKGKSSDEEIKNWEWARIFILGCLAIFKEDRHSIAQSSHGYYTAGD